MTDQKDDSTAVLLGGQRVPVTSVYHNSDKHCVLLHTISEGTAGPVGQSSVYKVTWIPTAQLQHLPPNTPLHPTAFKKPSMDKMSKKAQKTTQARQLQLMRLSGKIDDFAMRLYMSLSKTIPSRWYFEERKVRDARAQDTAIVVLDELIINPPYRLEDFIPAPDSSPQTIEWIGRIVERERAKLQ